MGARSSKRRAWWRRFKLGLPTILGLAPKGYFIPYRYAAEIAQKAAPAAFPALEKLFRSAEPVFRARLQAFEAYQETFQAFGKAPPPAPRFEQNWFPRLDAIALYSFIRQEKPRRIIEIGSGHSTRFAWRAIQDEALETELTAIDPAPRADIAALPITLRQEVLQATPLALFADLEAGDILSIDSSHILMPGSDLDLLLSEVLPQLPSGVFVHIHDIFLPDPYPESWAWRGYNEQQALAPLLFSGAWELLWSSHYLANHMSRDFLESPLSELPRQAGAFETALWMRRR